jgi:hypothetical protein
MQGVDDELVKLWYGNGEVLVVPTPPRQNHHLKKTDLNITYLVFTAPANYL